MRFRVLLNKNIIKPWLPGKGYDNAKLLSAGFWMEQTWTRFLMSCRLCSRICCFSVTTVPLGWAAWPSFKGIKHMPTSKKHLPQPFIMRSLISDNKTELRESWQEALRCRVNAASSVCAASLSTCAAEVAVCSSLCSSHRQRATMRAISMGFSRYLLCRCCLILRRLCW